MNLVTAMPHTVVATSTQANNLYAIKAPATQLALWQRQRPDHLAWMDRLDWETISDLDFTAEMRRIVPELAHGLACAGYPQGPDCAALHAELVQIVHMFAAIMDRTSVRIRLEVVETDACRKFHADHVTARLLMTLHGPGTQWIHVDTPDDIQHMALGEIGLFKGRLWQEQPDILHRSPPICASGETRLLLVVDSA